MTGGARFRRYVALGDSTTEGIDDPSPDGGYRGFADRLAEQLCAAEPELRYANLAIRGRLIRQVHAEQLAPALAMEPDLATVVGGINDLLRRRYDVSEAAGHMDAMLTALVDRGATVATFTLPDLSAFMTPARLVRGRLLAYNEALRELGPRTGALVVDLARERVAADPRLWSDDRLHANAAGHARIAAALGEALGVMPADGHWAVPLTVPLTRTWRAALAADLAWGWRHLAPWFVRRARGRSSGDGRVPKAPELLLIDRRDS